MFDVRYFRLVSRQPPAALDRYLTALPAMSLAPVAPFAEAMARQVRFDVNFGFRNQAATDAKQRPGFQPRNRGNGITEKEGEVARVATTELGSDGVSKQEARSEPRRPDR
jgi:hypothetical protein